MALFAKNTKIQSNFMNKKKIINNRVNFYKIIYKSIYFICQTDLLFDFIKKY